MGGTGPLMPQPSIMVLPVTFATGLPCPRSPPCRRPATRTGARSPACGTAGSAEGVEQRVHRRQHVEGRFLSTRRTSECARVGISVRRSPADGQQAEREREDVVQRRRGNAVDLAQVADFWRARREPGIGLQRGGNDVAVVSTAPLDRPVVPPVYCRKEMESVVAWLGSWACGARPAPAPFESW